MQHIELLNSYNKKGYIYEYWLLENGNTKLDYQHRILWEKAYGKIPKGYDIHHLNKNKTDNRLSKRISIFMLFGYVIYKSGNLVCLPAHLHTKLFHNINDKYNRE